MMRNILIITLMVFLTACVELQVSEASGKREANDYREEVKKIDQGKNVRILNSSYLGTKGSNKDTKNKVDVRAAAVPPRQPVYSVLKSDKTLSKTLDRWSQVAGWQLSWESHKDFAITLEATFHGSFKEAITNVVDGLAASDAPVQAIFYKNKVVRIVMRGTKIR